MSAVQVWAAEPAIWPLDTPLLVISLHSPPLTPMLLKAQLGEIYVQYTVQQKQKQAQERRTKRWTKTRSGELNGSGCLSTWRQAGNILTRCGPAKRL